MIRRLIVIVLLLLMLPSCRAKVNPTAIENEQAKTEPSLEASSTETRQTEAAQAKPGGETDWQEIPSSELFDLPWENNSLFLKSLRPKSRHWVTDLPYASRYRMELIISAEPSVEPSLTTITSISGYVCANALLIAWRRYCWPL